MNGDIHVDAVTVALIGALLTMFLGVISYFLSRLISQFDKLQEQFSTLNHTMTRIDKDLSGEVGILKSDNEELKDRVKDFDPLWDRMRGVEKEVAIVRASCIVHCKVDQ